MERYVWCQEASDGSLLLVNEASSLAMYSLLIAHPNLFKVERDTCCTSEGELFTKKESFWLVP